MAKKSNSKGFMESFTEFLSNPTGFSQDDIVAELQEQGINTNELEKSVMEIVKKGSKKRRLVWRERVRERRKEIDRILDSTHIVSGGSNLMNKIREILIGDFSLDALSHAETYFRKKEMVSEKDLESLIEDLEHLNLLEKTDNDKE